MIWNETKECMSRDEMNNLQGTRLVKLVDRVYHNVEYYRKKMQAVGLEPGDIRGLEDLPKLPFTTKDDLRDTYPFGMFAVPNSQIVRIHASSGTTGKATVVGYTRRDIDMWSECVARCIAMTNLGREDIIQVAYGYGLFTGGLGGHYGAEKMGAEPWTEKMRDKIEEKLGIHAHDIYGLSEIMGPGVATDCRFHKGLHVHEDYFLPEIVDRETFAQVPDGMTGELVISTLMKEGIPLIRYRTKDLTSMDHTPCECGRTTARIARFTGRSDDMLIIRGVNVFPSQIEAALLEMGGTTPHYLMIVDRVNNLDTLEVQVEVEERFFSDEIRELENLTRKIEHVIQQAIGLAVKVKLVEPKALERSMGKSVHVIDRRKMD